MDQIIPPTSSGAHVYRPSQATIDLTAIGDSSGPGEEEDHDDDDHDNDEGIQGHRQPAPRSLSPDWAPYDARRSSSPDGINAPQETPAPSSQQKRPATTAAPSRAAVKKPRITSGSAAISQLASSVTDDDNLRKLWITRRLKRVMGAEYDGMGMGSGGDFNFDGMNFDFNPYNMQ
ncbi:hypothetical protein FB451DRAFT_1411305 [Mycena latifolia]|nr:hypothetical protein FB451DRAFT_1411305 [Mycena latifolia]